MELEVIGLCKMRWTKKHKHPVFSPALNPVYKDVKIEGKLFWKRELTKEGEGEREALSAINERY